MYVAGGSLTIENSDAVEGQVTMTIKRQSLPRMESADVAATTFINESRLI